MKRLRNSIILLISLSFSCAQQEVSEHKPPMEQKSQQIRDVIRKLQPLSLPYNFDFSNEMESSAIKVDIPFHSQTFPGLNVDRLSGYLPDTSNWFAVLGFGSGADIALPLLFVIDKQGNQTDEILLSVSKCGSGGQFFCDANSVLQPGNQFALHSLLIDADFSNEGEMLPADTTEVHTTGFITPEGKIKMTLGEKPGTK